MLVVGHILLLYCASVLLILDTSLLVHQASGVLQLRNVVLFCVLQYYFTVLQFHQRCHYGMINLVCNSSL